MFRFLICLFISFNVYSSIINLKFNNFNSKIVFSEQEINYKDASADLTLVKNDCNKNIYQAIRKRLENSKKAIPLLVTNESEFILNVDGIDFKIEKNSAEAKWLYNFYKTIFEAKIENKFQCEKIN